jgi:hypothetical protein
MYKGVREQALKGNFNLLKIFEKQDPSNMQYVARVPVLYETISVAYRCAQRPTSFPRLG